MFASDYPHWDFDDPHEALKAVRDPEIRQKIRFDNAATLFAVRS
jgi:predicted TIM-barrel fold metal-dependent hydrolase